MPRHRYGLPAAGVPRTPMRVPGAGIPQRPVQQPTARQPPVGKKKDVKKTIIYLVIFLGIILIGFIIYLVAFREPGAGPSEEVIELTINELDAEIGSGEQLNYDISLLKLGDEDEYDIIVDYDIYTLDGRYFPDLNKEERITVKDESIVTGSITATVPAGRYELKVTAEYNGGKVTAFETFDITGEDAGIEPVEPEEPPETPEEPPEEPVEDDDFKFERITGLSDSELEAQALEKANINAPEAINSCLSISIEANQDFCLGQAAKESEKDFFCRRIADSTRKDGCYMDLALKGQPYLCDNIEDGYNKNTCLSLV